MKKIISFLFFALYVLYSPLFATDTPKLPSNIEYTKIGDRIDSYITENENTNAGLSLAIFAEDSILYESYNGYADRENGIVVDQNTVMEWGSSAKILVWISVMQLVERGKLSLSKDITEYIPEGFLTKLQYDTPLTIYNLMHHNAGWQESLLEIFVTDEKNLPDLKTALRLTEPRQVFKPGEFTAYSNWGAALAAYIVECVTEQPFYEYVHENIFAVLGIKQTALNVDLSDNLWVKEKRDSVKYYSPSGEELAIPYFYIPLYPAGMATGTLADFLRFAMALIPDATGNSPLFQEVQTLQDFYATSLYYADEKTARNSHGLWAGFYAVPTIGHGGNTLGSSANLLISPSSGIGVVVMTNQGSEEIYNYGIMPLIFGESESTNTTASDTAEMEGMYIRTRSIFNGMFKWLQLLSIYPFEYVDNLMLEPSVSSTKIMMSDATVDYVKINQGIVVFWFIILGFFVVAVIYALLSLIHALVHRIKHKVSNAFGALRSINDISIILCLINLFILVPSFGTLAGTYTSAFIQGIFFSILGLIPVSFTVMWTAGLQKHEIDKKDRRWLSISSVAGLIMTFNVIFWNLYMI